MRSTEVEAIPITPAPTCTAECRPVAWVRGGQFVGLEGEGGTAPCRDCLRAVREALGSSRVLHPLRARGVQRQAAGFEGHEAAGWDEVLDRLSFLFREAIRGQRRVVWISGGRPRLENVIPRRFGCFLPELTWIRRMPPRQVAALLFENYALPGEKATAADLETADLVLLWGTDPESGPSRRWLAYRALRDRGVRTIAVDPRGARSAREADLHLALRPGTDAALALGLAEAVRPARVALPSLPPLLTRVLGSWPPPRVSEVCGLAVEKLELAGKWLREAHSAVFMVGGGAVRHAEGQAAVHGISLLARLCQARIESLAPVPDPSAFLPLPSGPVRAVEVLAGDLEREIKERDPRRDVVLIDGGDPLLEFPAGGLLPAYLFHAHFIVVLASLWSPVCAFADLVLPTATFLEQPDAVGVTAPPEVRTGRAALSVRRDAHTEWAIWNQVAQRLGWPSRWFPADGSQLAGENWGPVPPAPRLAGIPGPWEPPAFQEAGEGPRSSPDTFRAYRLFLILAAAPEGGESGPPQVFIAPADAQARRIQEGQRVLVANDRGKFPAIARISPQEPAGVVTLAAAHQAERGSGAVGLLPPGKGEGCLGGETPGPCLVEVTPG